MQYDFFIKSPSLYVPRYHRDNWNEYSPDCALQREIGCVQWLGKVLTRGQQHMYFNSCYFGVLITTGSCYTGVTKLVGPVIGLV